MGSDCFVLRPGTNVETPVTFVVLHGLQNPHEVKLLKKQWRLFVLGNGDYTSDSPRIPLWHQRGTVCDKPASKNDPILQPRRFNPERRETRAPQ